MAVNITGMRTLVVSDLHLGDRLQRAVLRRPAALEAPVSYTHLTLPTN